MTDKEREASSAAAFDAICRRIADVRFDQDISDGRIVAFVASYVRQRMADQ